MEVFHGAFNNFFSLKILLLILGFVPWRGKPCSSSTGKKMLYYFKMVFGFGTQGVWVWWFEYIDLYTDISRQSCDPETPHKAVSVRCAFPAVSSPVHVVKWHLALLSCLFFFFLFCYKAIVCSLNQREIFLLSSQSMSAIWVNVWWHNTPYCPLPSLSLLLWSYSSSCRSWEWWQGLSILLDTLGLLMLLRVIFM